MDETGHIPVLANEVIFYLDLRKGERVVDATLGLGGHCGLIAKKVGDKGKIFAFEQDERNLERAKIRLHHFSDFITFFHTNFAHMREALAEKQVDEIDAALFDLGISSIHLDEAGRGFSFRFDGPLDMRMDQRQELTAFEIVNRFSEKAIADIIYQYGEERQSRRIAAAIIQSRKKNSIKTTTELAEIIARVKKFDRKGIHPATQTFQALRIYVNSELEVLKEGLQAAFDLLNDGGRMAVISFHSLEDRIVKNFFREKAAKCVCGPEVMRCECGKSVDGEILTKRPITAGEEEKAENPRSRSAKLRVLKKIKINHVAGANKNN